MEIYKNINLDKKLNFQPLYVQVYRALKDLILQGKLKKGDKLPPIRKLAKTLEVNNVTIVSAYRLLEEEELVSKKVGSGTYVAFDLQEEKDYKNLSKDMIKEEYIPSSLVEQRHIKIQENMINFASTTPSTDLFPVDDFKKVLNEVLDRDKGSAFGYQEIQGYYPLRIALKEYISHYGIHSDINNIHIISGAQQGIDIIAKGLLNYGDTVLIENPSYTGAMAAFQSRGAKIIDVALEKDGLNIQDLEKKVIAYKPKLLYVMPNFQNPTGISYSCSKKKEIIKIAQKYNFTIVEDDYLSDLNFFTNDNSTLKSLDIKDVVIYIKSFSKIFMPGLRLGFLVVPTTLFEEILLAKHSTDISTSGLLQRALELYLVKGTWQKHIKYMENQYKERFETMTRCILQYMPKEIEYTLPMGGVNFWFKLPMGLSSKELYKIAAKENIVFAPGNLFFLKNNGLSYFRLSIAAVNVTEIEAGMKKFSKIIKDFIYKDKSINISSNQYTPIL